MIESKYTLRFPDADDITLCILESLDNRAGR
jgi:hypothetical protein